MKIVEIESPYSGPTTGIIKRNIAYARCAAHMLVIDGFVPLASHLLYTQFLDDKDEEERELGITRGKQLIKPHIVAVFTDYGVSKGMAYGIKQAKERGITIGYTMLWPGIPRCMLPETAEGIYEEYGISPAEEWL